MNYFHKIITVTQWEYKRFYKLKNELIGIAVMLVMFSGGYFVGKLAVRDLTEQQNLALDKNASYRLEQILAQRFIIDRYSQDDSIKIASRIATEKRGLLLNIREDNFKLLAYRENEQVNVARQLLDEYRKEQALKQKGISSEDYEFISAAANVEKHYIFQPERGKKPVVAILFGGLMIMVVFTSFAYQFTAITGEKQLRITEQIVTAIGPQAWMDGKILGITLTGMSSVVTYMILAILGGLLYFQVTGTPLSQIGDYISLSALAIFFVFTILGVLMWNALMAAIAAIITDPNNSGKSSLMLLPSVFVFASMLVPMNPDGKVAIFLSWFPFTSASAMPMRWVVAEPAGWELLGSFAVLALTFYVLRRLAAKIFRVSILITGKEPSLKEIFKLSAI